jgi:hypothetical protein
LQHTVTQMLAEAVSLEEVAPKILLKLTEFSGENRIESLTSAAGEAILHG